MATLPDDHLPPGARRLRKLRVLEVSVVGVPAVPGARIALAKAGDPIQKAAADAGAVVTKGEVQEAVRLAKIGAPAPRSFWAGAWAGLVAQIGEAAGVPPAMATQLACRHQDGALLLAAMTKAA